ncbi:MAG: hypothetical protein HYX26_10265 [Acidobacteriales bacterium]|nr:hypothetical protein [Terriglobales bacterium]
MRRLVIPVLSACLTTGILTQPGTFGEYGVMAAQPAAPQYGAQRNGQRDPIDEKMERERQKAQNKERQESLKKDTDRLLALATELKEQVDKTDENRLSLDVLKKTEEIEKLAKQVREKMKADFMMPAPGTRSSLVR